MDNARPEMPGRPWEISNGVIDNPHVANKCVIRYHNAPGKGDHRHIDIVEKRYTFSTANQLMTDFAADIARWNHENSRT